MSFSNDNFFDDTLESDLLGNVLERVAGAERDLLLDEICGDDSRLRNRIEMAVKEIESGSGSTTEAANLPALSSLYRKFILQAGSRIGPFEVIEKIGEGGFGLVYRVHQKKPVDRQAALKVLRPGLDTLKIVRRFEEERQTLSRLQHPGIAAFYDAGATGEGRPWFAMELIEGVPITSYCDRKEMPIEERIHLFRNVCEAVHHAHLRGVLHRDLKPSNILVSRAGDPKPQPKVIDFGVARALDADPSTETLLTREGQMVGTPAYMSPEQVSLPSSELDIRSDVYSLGAVLYEMICGVPLLGNADVAAMGMTELLDAIRTRPVERPSARLQQCFSRRPPGVVFPGDGSVDDMVHRLKGDLDWIVMKALEKDRERRYDTAAGFSEDLAAFLENRPVTARPPSFRYLAGKFLRRHRLAVAGATIVMTTVVLALVVSVSLFLRERDARRLADIETHRSREVVHFLEDTLASVGPEVAMGRDTTLMKEVLRKTTERIGAELPDSPEIEAEIRLIVGRTWWSLTESAIAEKELKRALDLREKQYPGDHVEVAEALSSYTEALMSLGHFREAEETARRCLAMWENLEGSDHPHVGLCHDQIAFCLLKTGRVPEAEAMSRRAFEMWRKQPEEPLLRNAPTVRASVLRQFSNREEAIQVYQEELATKQTLYGDEHPHLVAVLDNLGDTLAGNRQDEEAAEILLRGVAMGRKFFGDRNPHEDHMLAALAGIAGRRGSLEEQLRYAREAAATGARIYAPDHRYFSESQGQLARVLLTQAGTMLDKGWQSGGGGEWERAMALLTELTESETLVRMVEKERPWIDVLLAIAKTIPGETGREGVVELVSGFMRNRETSDPYRKQAEVWMERLQPGIHE